MSLPTLDQVHHATLSGVPLLLVMLSCFLVGAFGMRLALLLDARALWRMITRQEEADTTVAKTREGEE